MLMLTVGMHLPLRDRRLAASLRAGAMLAGIACVLAEQVLSAPVATAIVAAALVSLGVCTLGVERLVRRLSLLAASVPDVPMQALSPMGPATPTPNPNPDPGTIGGTQATPPTPS
jgi:hypothetical protein